MDEQSAYVGFKRTGRGIFFPLAQLRDGRAKLTWSASVVFTPVR